MTYYMCPKCFTVYDSFRLKPQEGVYYCPNLYCDIEELFDIDELMIDPIQVLNMKGYRARFCCSGHTFSRPLHSYIMFDKCYKFDTTPKGWKIYNTKTYSIHDKDDYDYIPTSEFVTMVEVNLDSDELDIEKKRKIISERTANLLKWVYSLPEYIEKESEDDTNE